MRLQDIIIAVGIILLLCTTVKAGEFVEPVGEQTDNAVSGVKVVA